MKLFAIRCMPPFVQKKETYRYDCLIGVPMKTALLSLSILFGLGVTSYAQNKVPSFNVSFDGGIAGCVENDGYDSGANVAGRGGCDYPGAQYFLNGVYSFFCCNSFYGSYALTTRSLFDSINGYMLDGASFSGPIAPFSVSGNTWAVGGNNFIYHSGTFFDPTQGVLTTWGKVVTNIRGDAFVLGNAAAGFPTKKAFQPAGTGPLLAEFSGVDNSIVYATYLSSLGFASVPSMARDKGGNIYLSGNGPAPTYQPVLVKLSPNLPQKILYRKTLPYLGGPVAVDRYSEAYLMSGSSGFLSSMLPIQIPVDQETLPSSFSVQKATESCMRHMLVATQSLSLELTLTAGKTRTWEERNWVLHGTEGPTAQTVQTIASR